MPGPNPSPATLVFNIVQFKALGSGKTFNAMVTGVQGQANTDVYVTPQGSLPGTNVSVDANGTINVANPGPGQGRSQQLVFQVLDASGANPPVQYVPVGMIFKDGPSGDPLGQQGFGAIAVSGTGSTRRFYITDFDYQVAVSWDALLMVQRQSDGALGLIDPLIHNNA